MTRNGKIARLPVNIRKELNQRLENGEEGATLLAWLNALPEVQAILKAGFGGGPITKQNLSEWRLGGFREWQTRREWIEQAGQLADGVCEMEEEVDPCLLAGALAGALAARYAAVLNSWNGEPDEKIEAQLRLLRHLNRDIALLQKTIHQARRQENELEQARAEEDRRDLELEKKRSVAPILAKLESDAMTVALGGGERNRKVAEFLAAVKHDIALPPKWMEEVETIGKKIKAAAASEPVQPSQTESNRPQPGPTQSNQEL
jgi:hypothetical protein